MNGTIPVTKLKLQRTFIMKISYWLGLARWWLALHVMRRKDRNRVLYYFQFHSEAFATLRKPVFQRLERNAGYRIKEEARRRHGQA